jgi:UDP-N-acetylmuramoylalanine--D-glutamate ligase
VGTGPDSFRFDDKGIYHGDEMFVAADAMSLRGVHNFANAVLAISAVRCALATDASLNALGAGLESFKPLAHRMQQIGELNNVPVIDDGLATAANSAIAAHAIYSNTPAILFIGGHDRGIDYASLSIALTQRTAAALILTMGPAGKKVREGVNESAHPLLQFIDVSTLREGVQYASQHIGDAQVILFSPGGASYNEFSNYEERSAVFLDEFLRQGMIATRHE